MNLARVIPRGHDREELPFIAERLLREREAIWLQICHEYGLNHLIRQFLLTSTVALACYGVVMGVFNGALSAIASAIKLPILYLLTLAICLPTLYLFNLLYGGRLSVRQTLALVLAAITVMASLTLAFAPITIFFLITARDYEFFKLLNVAILALTGLTGLSFLVDGMRSMNGLEAEPDAPDGVDAALTTSLVVPETVHTDATEPPASPASKPPRNRQRQQVNMPLLWIWLFLFGFVGTQLGWTLRPFFGSPGVDFQVFRTMEGNFYADLAQTLVRLFR